MTLLEDAPRYTVERRSATGAVLGTVELEPTIFSVKVNVPLEVAVPERRFEFDDD